MLFNLFFNLLSSRCVKDETLKIHPSNQTSYNFEIQAFKFNGDYDQVASSGNENQIGKMPDVEGLSGPLENVPHYSVSRFGWID